MVIDYDGDGDGDVVKFFKCFFYMWDLINHCSHQFFIHFGLLDDDISLPVELNFRRFGFTDFFFDDWLSSITITGAQGCFQKCA